MPRELLHDNAAQADLIGIWVYSFENWGEAQAERYIDALEHGIGKLLNDPEDGKRREALRANYWSKQLKHHVIFYTFTDSELRIRRVLHEVMDPGLHL